MLSVLTAWSTESEAVVKIGHCNDPKVKHASMYYMNGVITTLTQAIENYTALGNLMLSSEMTSALNAQGVCIELGYKYNPTAGAILDFIESGQQLNALLTPSFLRQWVVLGAIALAVSDPAVVALLAYIGSKAGDSDKIDKAVIETQGADLMTDLFACRNVLLVPHSQGNLYAHQEHDLLYNKLKNLSPPNQESRLSGLRVVGVGSPDAVEAVFNSQTGYSTRYLWRTNTYDLVMAAVTLYLKTKAFTRLESNTDWGKNGGPFSFWAGNSFGHV